jgi:UDP-N-acetylglucosamine 2-epimerase
LRAASVLDVPAEAAAIGQAIRIGVSPEFRRSIRDQINPMGDGAAGRRIVEILEGTAFEALGRKRFRDL